MSEAESKPPLPTVGLNDTIRDAMAIIDRGTKGIAIVVDDNGRLSGTITDGDVRRAILASVDLNSPTTVLLKRKSASPHSDPITAPVGTPPAELLALMRQSDVRQVPLVNAEGRVVELVTLDELVPEGDLSLRAVVMAGGFGTRLRPLTDDLPKPMLSMGTKPLLELIVDQLRLAGIRKVNLATHYKGDLIAEHFKDGKDFGVDIQYIREDQPLGTAGALSRMEQSDEPILVINGDILTRVDFRAMLNFHKEHQSELTVAVKQYEFCVPYGVVDADGVMVTGISEKPVLREFINAGIYLLNSSVQMRVPNGHPYDIPDLVAQLIRDGGRVVCFPIREYWLDIGRADHYDQAKADIATGRY